MRVSFWQMTLQGGAFVLAVALVRAATLERLPKRCFVWLWIAALARFLLPLGLPILKARRVELATAQAVRAAGAERGSDAMWILWLIVAAVMAGWFAWSHIRCRRELRTAVPIERGVEPLPEVRGIRRRVELRTLPGLSTPLTYGVLRPIVVMPEGTDPEAGGGRLALLHELYHVRRFDAAVKGLSALALCLHWFNPAAWLLYALLGRDMEIACDEAALSELGGDARRAYALALLRFRAKRDGLKCGPVAFGGIADEERIRCVMKFQKKTFLTLALSLSLLAAFVLTAFAAGTTQPAPETAETEAPVAEPPVTETGEGVGTVLPGFGGVVTDGLSPDPERDYSGIKLYFTRVNPDGSEELIPVEPGLADGHKIFCTVNVSDFLTERQDGLYFMGYKLISVSHSDEEYFTSDQWTTVLRAIENGVVTWND